MVGELWSNFKFCSRAVI